MTAAEWNRVFSDVTVAPGEAAQGRVSGVVGAVSRWVSADRPVAAWVPVSSALSPTLLTISWLIGGAVQPASYSPVQQTVSVLAGHGATDRWIVTGSLYVIGVCHFATAAGLRVIPLRARVGLVVAGLAGIGIAACPEPVNGTTTQHAVCTGIGALAITVWPALAAQRHGPASILVSARVSAVVSVAFLMLLGWTIVETQNGGSLGLAERVSSAIQICWPFAVAVGLRRTTRTARGNQQEGERSGDD